VLKKIFSFNIVYKKVSLYFLWYNILYYIIIYYIILYWDDFISHMMNCITWIKKCNKHYGIASLCIPVLVCTSTSEIFVQIGRVVFESISYKHTNIAFYLTLNISITNNSFIIIFFYLKTTVGLYHFFFVQLYFCNHWQPYT